MFPLGSPLLPGGVLPLHVFEPRYRQMVIDCLQADGEPEFGQALITHGREAALLRWCELNQRRARALALVGREDEDD